MINAGTTAVFEFTNFRGGYATDIPVGEMADFELLQADNCYWREGITKRMGKGSYTSWTGTAVKAAIRSRIDSTLYTIVAVDTTSSGIQLMIGTDTAFSTISMASTTALTLTTAAQVQFAYLDNKIVAVDGVDEPYVIYACQSATVVGDTIEHYDTRQMDDSDWVAGFVEATLTNSAWGGYRYGDDTDDAQSSTTVDFALATATITSGFYIACNHTFNYVKVYGAQSIPTVTLAYYYHGHTATMSASETWVSFTPIDPPTWTAAGDKVIELAWPADPTTGESLYTVVPDCSYNIAGRYAWRALTVTQPSASAAYCTGFRADHTQYLSQILLDDKPDTISVHKSHVFLGMGNWMRVSPYNQVRGWRESDKEYFPGLIKQMVTQGDGLVVLLDNALYGITGNSWANWATQFLTAERGAMSKWGAVVVGDELYFMARDGIYKWSGSSLTKVSKHIRTDIDAEDASICAAVNYKGEAWFAYPTSGHVYLFDPDTFRTDDVGDGRVSFWKFPTYTASLFMPYVDKGDSGYLMAICNDSPPRLDRCEYDDVDCVSGTTATIPLTMMTKYFDFDNPHQMKTFRRIKPKVLQATTTAGGYYNLRFYRQDKFGGASYSVATITATLGTSEYGKELALPPRIDGKTFSLYVNHDAQTKARFLGFAIEVEGRKF